MQIKKTNVSPTSVKLLLTADDALLRSVKEKVLHKLSHQVKLSGFREGKAPLNLVEKNVDQSVLQSEFLDEAMNRMYAAVLREDKLRPVDNPKVNLKKFVPFTELELELEVEVVGE